MNLATLAAKQKRLKDWKNFGLQGGVQDPALKAKIDAELQEFSRLLALGWEKKQIDPDLERQIIDYERRLEQYNEEARLIVVGKKVKK